MYIDGHTHCRDEKASYKGETIEHTLRVAEDSRLSGIFDMPNIPDPITTKKRVLERIALAEAANSDVFFGIYVGVTPNLSQVEEAVNCYREFFPKPEDKVGVIGLKMFAGKSVDDLTVSKPEAQKGVYRQLVKNEYSGVLVVHCEKESEMVPDVWDPSKPITHCESRPEISEILSVKDQLRFAFNAGYAKCEFSSRSFGKLHIAHISVPLAVEFVDAYKDFMHVSCGATPHHLLLNNGVMESEIEGILYKVNPPLRSPNSQEILLEQFKCGLIDTLESDHAPHSFEDKTEKYLSGIPNLASWPDFIDILKARNVSNALLNKVAFENVNKIFGTDIKRINRPLKNHVQDYVFDPYKVIK